MSPIKPPQTRIDLADSTVAQQWCEHFGATLEQLQEAVKAVGDDPALVREHLLNQGASAGAG